MIKAANAIEVGGRQKIAVFLTEQVVLGGKKTRDQKT